MASLALCLFVYNTTFGQNNALTLSPTSDMPKLPKTNTTMAKPISGGQGGKCKITGGINQGSGKGTYTTESDGSIWCCVDNRCTECTGPNGKSTGKCANAIVAKGVQVHVTTPQTKSN